MTARCWWCQHGLHIGACRASWRQVGEEGVCGCLRTPDETKEQVRDILAPAIAEALRGPTATVRASDIRRANRAIDGEPTGEELDAEELDPSAPWNWGDGS